MSDSASVNSVRQQIKNGLKKMGPIETMYSDAQKEWLETMRDRLASRLEQRRERIALALVGRSLDWSARGLTIEILATEGMLDQLELQDRS
jgi:hypothetical protein